ncbi:MAG: hypothetical protein A2Y40_02815 [Candidatus Margulisbacteria bacterium GWF2_35_9]|nr:MAG: hypothetical protein A2Y40_02815 [Candidatus Margulisbacteria bacterium GWF2_35_9]
MLTQLVLLAYGHVAINFTYFQVFDLLPFTGVVLHVFSAPYFFIYLMGEVPDKQNKIIIWIATLLMLCLSFFYFFSHNLQIARWLLQPLLFSVDIWSIIYIFTKIKLLQNRLLRKYLRILIIFVVTTFPFVVLDALLGTLPFAPFDLALPLFFLVLNWMSLFFLLRYFNEPAYLQNNTPTDYFCKQYDITKREAEIISFILKGHSNKQVAEELFISPKTVENHLGNIYLKMDVKNRIQLSRILQSSYQKC